MRRNWLTVLIFALALAIQVVAPVAVNVALAAGTNAAAVSKPSLVSTELCVKEIGSNDTSQQAPGRLKGHRGDCVLCQAACDGVAQLGARAIQLGRAPVRWTPLPWTVADRALPLPVRDYSRQARAPPTLS